MVGFWCTDCRGSGDLDFCPTALSILAPEYSRREKPGVLGGVGPRVGILGKKVFVMSVTDVAKFLGFLVKIPYSLRLSAVLASSLLSYVTPLPKWVQVSNNPYASYVWVLLVGFTTHMLLLLLERASHILWAWGVVWFNLKHLIRWERQIILEGFVQRGVLASLLISRNPYVRNLFLKGIILAPCGRDGREGVDIYQLSRPAHAYLCLFGLLDDRDAPQDDQPQIPAVGTQGFEPRLPSFMRDRLGVP